MSNAQEALEKLRLKLLDLSARNRLLNHSDKGAKVIQILNDDLDAIYQHLVVKNSSMKLRPLPDQQEGQRLLPAPDRTGSTQVSGDLIEKAVASIELDDTTPSAGGTGLANSQEDFLDLEVSAPQVRRLRKDELLTSLTSDQFDGRLRRINSDYDNFIESTGSNLLFMAIGFLEWYDLQNDPDKPRLAPLILVPLDLKKRVEEQVLFGAGGNRTVVRTFHYFVEATGEDLKTNLSLAQKLKLTFNIELPKLNPELELESAESYFEMVRALLSLWLPPHGKVWKVHEVARIGFFTFGKDVMYRDLDPENWPNNSLISHEVVQTVLVGRQKQRSSSPTDEDLEKHLQQHELPTILDADSSQLKVILRALKGDDLVVQGPPGAGKSQTIANIIAAAMAANKSVLFMAEKLAALKVVKSRLEAARLGHYCLELHSSKANPKAILSQIQNRLSRQIGRQGGAEKKIQVHHKTATSNRKTLGRYRQLMATHVKELGLTIHQIFWKTEASKLHFQKLLSEFQQISDVHLPAVKPASAADLTLLVGLKSRMKNLQDYLEEGILHYTESWRGFSPGHLSQDDVITIESILDDSIEALQRWEETRRQAALQCPLLESHSPVQTIRLAEQIKATPPPAELIEELAAAFASNEGTAAKHERVIASLRFIQQECDASAKALATRSDVPTELFESSLQAISHSRDHAFAGKSYAEANEAKALIRQLATHYKNCCELSQALADQAGVSFNNSTLVAQQLTNDLLKLVLSLDDEIVPHLENCHGELTARHSLTQARTKSEQLEGIRSELEQYYIIEDAPASSDLAELRQTLREGAGTFLKRWPFGRVANAKRKARRFAKSGVSPFSAEFIENLTRLEMLPSMEKAFISDARVQACLGSLFKGTKTDWPLLDQLVEVGKDLRDLLPVDAVRSRLFEQLMALCSRKTEITQLIHNWENTVQALGEFNPQFYLPRGLDSQTCSVSDAIAALEKTADDLELRLAGISTVLLPAPADWNDFVSLVKTAITFRTRAEEVENFAAIPSFLGSHYKGLYDTSIAALEETLSWCKRLYSNRDIGVPVAKWILSQEDQRKPVEAIIGASAHYHTIVEQLEFLDARAQGWCKVIGKLQDFGSVDPRSAYNPAHCDTMPTQLLESLSRAREATHVLIKWSDFQWTLRGLQDDGFAAVSKLVVDGLVPPAAGEALAEATFYNHWWLKLLQQHSELDRFRRIDHERLRKDFAEADREIPELFQQELDRHLFKPEGKLPEGVATGRVGDMTEMALIKRELDKKARYLHVRELISRSGNALLQMMPCWMMGPTSVAQFLPPGKVEFDLVIIDEASQVRPEEALGSLARAKQIVVVGDSNQMPPSNTFMAMGGAADGDDEFIAEDMSSILELLEKYYDQEYLAWHYRSLHESLIRFSNERFYDRRLIIPPTVYRDHPELGIKWHFCEGARYHKSINEREAADVVKHLADHIIAQAARPLEDQESIGVVAINAKQQELIEELFDRLVLHNAELKEALDTFTPKDPIFIRNLENVQGDERDVIIISFTYGPDMATGEVYQRFGPIARSGGWRRLNVLFTRARKRVVIFTSMKASDIRPGADVEARNGVPDLKAYLEYAESGRLSDFGKVTGKGPDSDFEVSVAIIVEQLGFVPHYQVGVDGFRIDIGVVDPASPEVYICGIECDGAAYHSLPVARDRDRLREDILHQRGWELYRIWSADWYRNRNSEIERLSKYLKSKKGVRKVSTPSDVTSQNQDASGSDGRTGRTQQPWDLVLTIPETTRTAKKGSQVQNSFLTATASVEATEQSKNGPAVQVVEVGDSIIYVDLEEPDEEIHATITAGASVPEWGQLNKDTVIGKALLGRGMGDEVVARPPAGPIRLKIVSILRYESQA